MKKMIQTTLLFLITAVAGLLTSSCDHCDGMVCTNGYCSNGMCVCNEGYERKYGECLPLNRIFVGENLSGTETNNVTGVSKPVSYTIEASEKDPFEFTLKDFYNIVGNDITFRVDPIRKNEILEQAVSSPFGFVYTVSGSKVGNKLSIQIGEALDQATRLSMVSYSIVLNM